MAKDVLITPASGNIVFNDTAVEKASIFESDGDLVITSNNGTVIIGDGTASNIEFGDIGIPATFSFAGGGDISSNGSTLNVGLSGDTINLNVTGVTYNLPSSIVTTNDYTANDVFAKVKSLDGSGSGLDADLLDGIGSDRFSTSAISIFSGGNWDNLILNGIYSVNHSDFLSDTNPPPATYSWGILVVDIAEIGGQDRIQQTYYPHQVSDKYIYHRMRNITTWTSWSKIWRGGTGSGSGLDADSLDSIEASSFVRSDADDSISGALTLSNTVTSSSTISALQLIATSNGAGTNVKIGDDAWIGDINSANTIRITGIQDATSGYLVFGNSNSTALGRTGTGSLTYGGNTLWHSGNDGVSSGLDADLLDGLHSSSFSQIYTLGTFTDYRKTVVLLVPEYNGTLLSDSRMLGTLEIRRGSSVQLLLSDSFEIKAASAYNATHASVIASRAVSGTNTHIVTVLYNGIKWRALHINTPLSAGSIVFRGYKSSWSADQGLVISYYDTQTPAILNAEINSSLSSSVANTSIASLSDHIYVGALGDKKVYHEGFKPTYTDVGAQPADATLTALAGLETGADKLAYSTGTDTFSQTTLTSFARTLLDDIDESTARITLGANNASNLTTGALPDARFSGSYSSVSTINAQVSIGTSNVNNSSANVSLKFISDIASLRYGGSGVGSSSGFQIVGVGDSVKVAWNDAGAMTIGTVPTTRITGIIADANLSGNYTGVNISGNASTATTLASTRTVAITGQVSASGTFNGSADLTLNATINEDSTHRFVTDAEKTLWADKYTQTEINNLLSSFSTGLDWKETVATFADLATTYPTAVDGWTVNTQDTDITYRYTGTDWVAISANSIPMASSVVDGKMSSADKIKLDGFNPTSVNSASQIVARDASGNFSAGTITATLSGNASTASTLQTARTINGVSFNGSANITIADSTKLPLTGGTLTGDVTFTQDTQGIAWSRNTDGASIRFYSTSDSDTDSRLEFQTLDNNNEYFRWTHKPSGLSAVEWMNLKSGALTVSGSVNATNITVTSNSIVTNLNSDLLDGQHGAYYLDWTNATNKPDPVITVTLTGDVSGTANTTLTDLASGTITVSTTIADDSHAHSIYQPIDADLTAIAALAGTSGLLKKTAVDTWTLDTNTYITGNQSITVSGDATGSGSTAITLTLANSGATAGTYGSSTSNTSITVDAKGRITSISNVTPQAATTSVSGIVQLSSSTSSTSTTLAATPSAVKTAYDLANAAIPVSQKGAVNGVATLDASGLVPSTQLPSYVDDVLEYANLAALPGTGSSGKIYVTLDTNKIYRWTGTVYIEISPVVGNSDTATKLATARTISISGDASGSGLFDGSSDISISVTVVDDSHNHTIPTVTGLQTALDSKLSSSAYTAADVLNKIKTVDGASSGLDADLLDGLNTSSNAVASTVMTRDASGNTAVNAITVSSGFVMNPTTLSSNFTIPSNTNAMTAGPIAIADGVTIVVSDGSTWVVV